jgi:hypothetical protein
MGYLNKVLHSDVFVWLHSVQFRKNYYQNRTKIKNITGAPLWLTLPVHAHLDSRVDEVMIADPRWKRRIQKTIEQCYRGAPFFTGCRDLIEDAIEASSDNLNDVNLRTFRALLDLLAPGKIRLVLIDDLEVEDTDPTGRLVEVCRRVGATRYIAGKGGANYLQVEQFRNAMIQVLWQEFNPEKVVYPQLGDTFVPGLSAVDCLFNNGPDATRAYISQAWSPTPL